jgi:hypothetical protein
MGFQSNNLKPVNFSGTNEQIQVTGTARSELEIISNYDNTWLNAPVQKVLQKLVGGLAREFSCERYDQQMINAQSTEHFNLFFETGEQFEIGAGFSENFSGMRPEGYNQCRGLGLHGNILETGKKILMPPVNAVKNSNGNGRPEELK